MRYLPLTGSDRAEMLAAVAAGAEGVHGIDDLYRDVPVAARRDRPLDLPGHAGELAVARALEAMAAENLPAGAAPCFLGAGAYRHHVPAAVDALVQRGEFLTSYTPYQPEISQGTLQALFEFQTQVASITGMEVANASMYDGASACAEAVLMAARITRRGKAVLSGGLHPHYAETVETLARFAGLTAARNPPMAPTRAPHGTAALERLVDDDTACVVVQQPDLFGTVRDFFRPRRGLPCARRAAGGRGVRAGVARRAGAAGRLGRRHRCRRGAGPGGRPELRRPACRPVRHPRTLRAPDAGAAGGRDGGRRRAPRLGADPERARTAHPPRQGDEQHLHQCRPVRAGLLDPSEPARGDRGSPASRGSTTRSPCAPPPGSTGCRDSRYSTAASSTNSPCACRATRRPVGGDPGGAGRACRRARLAAGAGPRRPHGPAARRGHGKPAATTISRPSPTAWPRRWHERPRHDYRQSRPRHRGADDLRTARAGPHRSRPAGPAGHAGRRPARRPGAARARRPARPCGAAGGAPLHAPVAQQFRYRQRHLPARLMHDEAQPAPEREAGAAARLRRPASVAAAIDGAGRAAPDGPAWRTG